MEPGHFFSTPLSHLKLDHGPLNDSLEQYILNHLDTAHANPNPPQELHSGLFESRFDFLKWEVPVIQQFRPLILDQLFLFLLEVNQLTRKQLQALKFDHESWFHVSRDGAFFQPHTHPNHSWSLVYCVSPGDPQTETPQESGRLMFFDPRVGASMNLDKANVNLQRTLSFNALKLALMKGSLVIFPAYLQHAVEPYRGTEPRITIAANFRFF